MKTKRIAVLLSEAEKEEIEQWAACEGRSASNYLQNLHRDYMRRAKSEGQPKPFDEEVG